MVYQNHYDEDTDEPIPYCCECDRWFVDDAALTSHLEKSYSHNYCSPCDRDFVSLAARQRHWQTSNRHTATYCSRCDLNFPSNNDRLNHKRLTPSRHFMCEPCDLDCTTYEHLKEHFSEAVEHRTTYCWKCERNFVYPNNLREHQKVHMPRDLNCWGCGGNKRFATVSAMTNHLEGGTCLAGWKSHHVNCMAIDSAHSDDFVLKSREPWLRAGSPPNFAMDSYYIPKRGGWVCLVCDLVFAQKAGLHSHLQTQRCCSGYPEVLKCPVCPDRFSTLSGLFQHIETPRCPASKNTRCIAQLLKTLKTKLSNLTLREELDEVRYKLESNPDRHGSLIVKVSEASACDDCKGRGPVTGSEVVSPR